MNNYTPFILTIISGFSTMLGTIPIFFHVNKEKIINISLALTAGILINTSILELLPNAYYYFSKSLTKNFSIILILIFLNIGIILYNIFNNKENSNTLYKTGIADLIVIMLHNIPEGIITYLVSDNNIKLGLTLTIAIIFHNIPEGLSIAIPIYYGTYNKKKALTYTLFASISEPFGALIASIFLKDLNTSIILGILLTITSAIMINLSLKNLLPYTIKNNKHKALIWFIIGFISMMLIKF